MADNVAQEVIYQQNLNRAVRLRVRGAHWNEIAEACDFSSAAAALAAVGRAMEAATQRAAETADQRRDTANLRLEFLLSQTLDMLEQEAPQAYDSEGNPLDSDDRAVKLRAVDEARRLVESQNKLNGVTAPKDDAGDDNLTIRIVGLDPRDLV